MKAGFLAGCLLLAAFTLVRCSEPSPSLDKICNDLIPKALRDYNNARAEPPSTPTAAAQDMTNVIGDLEEASNAAARYNGHDDLKAALSNALDRAEVIRTAFQNNQTPNFTPLNSSFGDLGNICSQILTAAPTAP